MSVLRRKKVVPFMSFEFFVIVARPPCFCVECLFEKKRRKMEFEALIHRDIKSRKSRNAKWIRKSEKREKKKREKREKRQ